MDKCKPLAAGGKALRRDMCREAAPVLIALHAGRARWITIADSSANRVIHHMFYPYTSSLMRSRVI